MTFKTYSDLILYDTFEDRFNYLKISNFSGETTFGNSRYLNQGFYNSRQWKKIRDFVIVRDDGLDLGVPGHEIFDKVIVHHIMPITEDDIIHQTNFLIDPEFLICVSPQTHNAIHFGDETLLFTPPIERSKNDTSPWLRH